MAFDRLFFGAPVFIPMAALPSVAPPPGRSGLLVLGRTGGGPALVVGWSIWWESRTR